MNSYYRATELDAEPMEVLRAMDDAWDGMEIFAPSKVEEALGRIRGYELSGTLSASSFARNKEDRALVNSYIAEKCDTVVRL